MGTIKTVRICQDKHIPIESEPKGDFLHAINVLLVRQDEPTEKDVAKAAEGKWIYRPVRLFISVDAPPVYGWLDVHTHGYLKGVKREYLDVMLPQDLPPRIVSHDLGLEGSLKLTLYNYYHQLLLLTLPGDRVYIHIYKKEPFRGELNILFC
jgi:hypothetical protein